MKRGLKKDSVLASCETSFKENNYISECSKEEIRRILQFIVSDSTFTDVSLRDCLLVYLHYVCKMTIKSLASVCHEDANVDRGTLFDPERKVILLLPRPWALRFHAYLRMSDKGAPTLFYISSKTHVFALSSQAVANIIRHVTRAALLVNKKKNTAVLPAQSNVEKPSSLHLQLLKKKYQKHHPRA